MARSNKPMIWSLFAAGGTIAAFVMPILMLLTIMAGYGQLDSLGYDGMKSFASGWIGSPPLTC